MSDSTDNRRDAKGRRILFNTEIPSMGPARQKCIFWFIRHSRPLYFVFRHCVNLWIKFPHRRHSPISNPTVSFRSHHFIQLFLLHRIPWSSFVLEPDRYYYMLQCHKLILPSRCYKILWNFRWGTFSLLRESGGPSDNRIFAFVISPQNERAEKKRTKGGDANEKQRKIYRSRYN